MIGRSPRHYQPMPPLRGAGCITVSFRPAIPRRPGRTSLTRGNVGGSHTPGKRLEDGKFAEVWDLADMDSAMRQIGQDEMRP
jgi:hypothetical protein